MIGVMKRGLGKVKKVAGTVRNTAKPTSITGPTMGAAKVMIGKKKKQPMNY